MNNTISFLFTFQDQDTHGTLSVRAETVDQAVEMVETAGLDAVFIGIAAQD